MRLRREMRYEPKRRRRRILPSRYPLQRPGLTETGVVKRLAEGDSFNIGQALGGSPWSVPRSTVKRIRKRVAKKRRQPFRRKDRGPLRARAAGKNEVRPCAR